jgi:hypothetical protein
MKGSKCQFMNISAKNVARSIGFYRLPDSICYHQPSDCCAGSESRRFHRIYQSESF